MDQFIEDCRATQETAQPLRYSWLLIIIAFVGWKVPRDSQFLTVPTDYRGVRYANLWATRDPEHENLSNMVFYTYYQMFCEAIQKMPRITNEVTMPIQRKSGSSQTCTRYGLNREVLRSLVGTPVHIV